jgi:hypothetical protein
MKHRLMDLCNRGCLICVVVSLAGCGSWRPVADAVAPPSRSTRESTEASGRRAVRDDALPDAVSIELPDEPPFLAIWLDWGELSNGDLYIANRAAVRIAVWDDGTVVHAPSPGEWTYQLKTQVISLEAVAALKSKIREADPFALSETRFGYDDGQVVSVMIRVDGKSQRLYGNEFFAKTERPRDGNKAALLNAWSALAKIARDSIDYGAGSDVQPFARGIPNTWHAN